MKWNPRSKRWQEDDEPDNARAIREDTQAKHLDVLVNRPLEETQNPSIKPEASNHTTGVDWSIT